MGFSISWLAVNGKAREAVLDELGLSLTGERDELPAESPIAGLELEGGWYLVVFDRYEHELVADDVLRRLSKDCEVVAAGAEEHVMCSFAAGWGGGERHWSIAHDSEQGIGHLDIHGSLPAGAEELRDALLAEQRAAGGDAADVDYVFDIPLETAKLVTGFAHTESEPETGFTVLRAAD